MLGPKPDVERGPWHFEIMNFGGTLGIVRAGAEHGKGKLLAQMIGGTREAEGRLMAAAPDLLEAACLAQQTFIELFCEYECECVGPGSGCESCPVSKALAVLDKAIRRAKGEEEDGPFKGEEAHSCESGTDAK